MAHALAPLAPRVPNRALRQRLRWDADCCCARTNSSNNATLPAAIGNCGTYAGSGSRVCSGTSTGSDTCEVHRWRVSDWSPCNTSCGVGVSGRLIECANSLGLLAPLSACDAESTPISESKCEVGCIYLQAADEAAPVPLQTQWWIWFIVASFVLLSLGLGACLFRRKIISQRMRLSRHNSVHPDHAIQAEERVALTKVFVFHEGDPDESPEDLVQVDAPIKAMPAIHEDQTIDVLSSVDEDFDPKHGMHAPAAKPWSLAESLLLAKARPSQVQIKETLGRGAFGEVVLADHNGEPVAIKLFHDMYQLQDVHQLMLKKFVEEVDMLRALKHENVVAFRGILIDDKNVGLIMDYLPGGSLFGYIHNQGKLHWPVAQKILATAARGLEYLHGRKVIHRDIKSANMLLTEDLSVKLADFGLSRSRSESTVMQSNMIAGSPPWMAPEAIKENLIDYKCDVYSFAITMWELAYRSVPWCLLTHMQVIYRVCTANERPVLGDREHLDPLPPEFIPLMEECWASDPAKRPDMATVHRRLLSMRVSSSLSLSEASYCSTAELQTVPAPLTAGILSPS
jgi:tRNA A-37 threonylcarbamoyl transferase component Bud32